MVLTKHVILIMRIIDIIRDSFKHDDNRQERPNEGPILNFNKWLCMQSLKKKFDTRVEKSMVFKTLKKQTVHHS